MKSGSRTFMYDSHIYNIMQMGTLRLNHFDKIRTKGRRINVLYFDYMF